MFIFNFINNDNNICIVSIKKDTIDIILFYYMLTVKPYSVILHNFSLCGIYLFYSYTIDSKIACRFLYTLPVLPYMRHTNVVSQMFCPLLGDMPIE